MSVYDNVVSICKPYLGPATEKFLARQCGTHLKIEPQQLSSQHLADLAKWTEVSAGLVMDKGKAVELAGKIKTAA